MIMIKSYILYEIDLFIVYSPNSLYTIQKTTFSLSYIIIPIFLCIYVSNSNKMIETEINCWVNDLAFSSYFKLFAFLLLIILA